MATIKQMHVISVLTYVVQYIVIPIFQHESLLRLRHLFDLQMSMHTLVYAWANALCTIMQVPP